MKWKIRKNLQIKSLNSIGRILTTSETRETDLDGQEAHHVAAVLGICDGRRVERMRPPAALARQPRELAVKAHKVTLFDGLTRQWKHRDKIVSCDFHVAKLKRKRQSSAATGKKSERVWKKPRKALKTSRQTPFRFVGAKKRHLVFGQTGLRDGDALVELPEWTFRLPFRAPTG